MAYSRRDFLRAPAAAFAFCDATMDRLSRLDPRQGGPDDEAFWREVRGHFLHAADGVSFNHAGLSPSPRAVREAMAHELARCDTDPSRVLWRQQEKELDGVRARLGRQLGCPGDQVALVPNATWGLHTAILGLALEPGDEIVATAHEYSRTFHALRQRRDRDGVTTVEVPIETPPAAPEAIAAAVLAACTARTRLVVVSQMTWIAGQILPVRAVATALAPRGVPVLVDGAHGFGLLPDTVADLGGAFYAACLHKWAQGPVGTGVFVCDPAWLDRVLPLCPGEQALDRHAAKFEQYGTRCAAPFLALREALDFHDWLGLDRKAERLEALRCRLARALDGVRGITAHGSLDPTRARAIWPVSVAGCDSRQLAVWLWREFRFHVTTVEVGGGSALRLSPHVFTSCDEIDRLAAALSRAARDGI